MNIIDPFVIITLPPQISSKLIHVASGTDVAEHLPQFHKHFLSNGSPVMIG